MHVDRKRPFDVKKDACDQDWYRWKPYKLVLEFTDDPHGCYFQDFHDAWIICFDETGLYQCKWDMIRAEKGDKIVTVYLRTKSPVPTTWYGEFLAWIRAFYPGGGQYGTGSGNVYGSSSTPTPTPTPTPVPTPTPPIHVEEKTRPHADNRFHDNEVIFCTTTLKWPSDG